MATRRDGATVGVQKVAEVPVGDLNQRYLAVQQYFYGGGFSEFVYINFHLLCNCSRAKNIFDIKSINMFCNETFFMYYNSQ